MTPELLNVDSPSGSNDGSFRWRELRRLCGLLWPERKALLIGTLLTIVFAGLNTGGIAGVFPLLKVILEKEGLHGWVYRWSVEQRVGAAFSAPDEIGDLRVVRVESDGPAVRAGLQVSDRLVPVVDSNGTTSAFWKRAAGAPVDATIGFRVESDTNQGVVAVPLGGAPYYVSIATWFVGKIPQQTLPGNITTLAYLLGGLVVVVLVANGFRYWGEVVIAGGVLRSMMHLRGRLYERTLDLPLSYHLAQPTSDLVTRFVQDIHEIQRGLLTLFGRCIREPLRVVLILSLAFALDWRITLAMVVVAPAAVVIFWSIGRSVKKANRKLLQRLGAMLGAITASLQSIRVVKAYGAEDIERRRLAEIDRRMFNQQLRIAKLEAATGPLIESLAIMAGSVLAVWLASRVLSHDLSLSKFGTLGIALSVLFDPLRKLSDVYVKVLRSTAGAERIFSVIDSPGEVAQSPPGVTLGPLTDRITFSGVNFTYPGGSMPALRDVHLDVRQGETVAVVGPNGSGKTTLVSLLLRFFDPQRGSILCDGKNIKEVSLRELRRQFALVTQDAVVFAGTPIENIAYGDPAPDRERAIAAAKQASADQFILAIPGGFDAMLGERGTTLSGGQRQRISIARAIYRNAAILIFDEATSQIDAESEQVIHKALRDLAVGRTTFIIAHRLSTIQFARRIIVMEDGRMIDTGTHAELYERCGLYRTLCETQLVADVHPNSTPQRTSEYPVPVN